MADEKAPAASEAEDSQEREHRTFVNLVVAAFLLALAIGVIWVVKTLDDQRKLQDCLNSGRRNCADMGAAPAPRLFAALPRDRAILSEIDLAQPAPL